MAKKPNDSVTRAEPVPETEAERLRNRFSLGNRRIRRRRKVRMVALSLNTSPEIKGMIEAMADTESRTLTEVIEACLRERYAHRYEPRTSSKADSGKTAGRAQQVYAKARNEPEPKRRTVHMKCKE